MPLIETERLAELYERLDRLADWLQKTPRYTTYREAEAQINAIWRTLRSAEDEAWLILEQIRKQHDLARGGRDVGGGRSENH